jgi:ATP-binding cassette subfamily B protein
LQFDKIIVLEHGEMKEQGSHEVLMQKRGIYFAMYQRQLQEQDAG